MTQDYTTLNADRAYKCSGCGRWMRTVDVAVGYVPAFVRCEVCGNVMACVWRRLFVANDDSPVPDGVPATPTHEWYRPTLVQVLTRYEWEHVHASGGLLLRRKA